MKNLVWALAVVLGCLGCDDGDGGAVEDAEARVDALVDARTIAPPDRGLRDLGAEADGAPRDAGGPMEDGALPDAAVDAAPIPQCADGEDNDGDGRVDLEDRGCADATDDNEGDEIALPECDDAEDNDGDGQVDLADADCSSPADPRERGGNAVTACTNGLDDDGDGAIDFPQDPGCNAAGDDDETTPDPLPQCANGVDDDADARIDHPFDPGCAGRGDSDERDPVRAPDCANGLDDDGDGAIDHPDDTGCESAASWNEVGPCGADVDVVDLTGRDEWRGDLIGAPANTVGSCGGAAGGERVFLYVIDRPLERITFSTLNADTQVPTVVYVRLQCAQPGDLVCNRGAAERPGTSVTLEAPARGRYYVIVDTGTRDPAIGAFRLTVDAEATPACRDGLDNDEDGRLDAADPGCLDAEDPDEADPDEPPVCADGVDNDMDGLTDHPDDPECRFAGGVREERLCAEGTPTLFAGQAGGQFEVPIAMGGGGAAPSCGAPVSPEVAIILTLDAPSDVTVTVTEADGRAVDAEIHIREECLDPATEVACARNADGGTLTAEALPRGTYAVLLEQGFVPPLMPRTAQLTVLSVIGACNDEVDNDEDGLIDLADPGCEQSRDQDEEDPAVVPECSNGIDDDEDGQTDFPDDNSCVAAGDPSEGGCRGHPQWRPVECMTGEWVWSNDRRFQNVADAAANGALRTGCRHANDNNDEGLCSLDGTGWVSTETTPMAGCNQNWWHLGGRFTGACGGHDGDTTRILVLDEDDCFDY